MKNKKDLIAQISQNLAAVPVEPVTAPVPENTSKRAKAVTTRPRASAPPPKPELSEKPPSTGSGKQAAFWLDDEDRAIFHETGMLLYSQGIKPSHNLVLRAAIRMIPRDHRLVEKVRELIEKDGRKVRHQKK